MTIAVLLMVVALICFLLAAIPVPTGRFNALAWGLFFWVLAILAGQGAIRVGVFAALVVVAIVVLAAVLVRITAGPAGDPKA